MNQEDILYGVIGIAGPPVLVTPNPYEGPYTVIPTNEQQILHTANTQCQDNIIVEAIEEDPYEGPYVITPTKDTQELNTEGTLCEDNITVEPIPDNYIDTSDADAGESDIALGKTAYVDGIKIYGNRQDGYIPTDEDLTFGHPVLDGDIWNNPGPSRVGQYGSLDWLIENYGSRITINNAQYLLQNSYKIESLNGMVVNHIGEYMFYDCHNLKEIKELKNLYLNPVRPGDPGSYAGPYYVLKNLYRVKNVTFEKGQDWTGNRISKPYLRIDATKWGYFDDTTYAPDEKEVTDAASYELYKDDPDWWTADPRYSRYNKNSAYETLKSLPDCSDYGVSQVKCTITFKGIAGQLTDGGAINTLTPSAIRMGTNKGWTVGIE